MMFVMILPELLGSDTRDSFSAKLCMGERRKVRKFHLESMYDIKMNCVNCEIFSKFVLYLG